MANNSLSEAANSLFQAMDILTERQVSQLQFDKTLVCTIMEVVDATKGIYRVTDGTSIFTAYAEDTTEYKENTQVYVKIPNGDMVNQKIITGKYMASENDSITYVSPLNAFIDITSNVINDNIYNGLIANGETLTKEVWKYSSNVNEEEYKKLEQKIAELTVEKTEALKAFGENLSDEDKANKEAITNTYDTSIEYYTRQKNSLSAKTFKGFTRLAISGQFKTLLDINTASGSYGLRLEVAEKTAQGISKLHNYYLSTEEMYGDPYKYSSYYLQEALYDISDLYEITHMRLILYQNNDFLLENGERLDPKSAFTDNILLQLPYISLGYASDNFKEDKVILSTYDPITYSIENKNMERSISMNWVHKTADKFLSINTADEMPKEAEIHWYRRQVGIDIADPLAGSFWQEVDYGENPFKYYFIPKYEEEHDLFKVIIEYPSRAYITDSLKEDAVINELVNAIQQGISENLQELVEQLLTIVDINELIERYDVIYGLLRQEPEYQDEADLLIQLYDEILLKREATQYYISEDFDFYNEVLLSGELLDLVQGLKLIVDKENYNGVYHLYNKSNQLINPLEGDKKRIIQAVYNSIATGENGLKTAESITWYFPKENTMIEPLLDGVDYSTQDGDIVVEDKNDYFGIRRLENYTTSTEEEIVRSLEANQIFRIKPYYNQQFTNNTVICVVESKGRTYSTEATLIFGRAGDIDNANIFNLTLYDFIGDEEGNIIELREKTRAITKDTGKVLVIPEVYDYNNRPIDLSGRDDMKFRWYNEGNKALTFIETTYNDAPACIITAVDGKSLSDYCYYILTADITFETITNAQQKRTIYGYAPIAVRASEEYDEIEGPNIVLYGDKGIDYFQKPFRLLDKEQGTIDAKWYDYILGEKSFAPEDIENINKFYPTVEIDGLFIPTSMYYDTLKPYGVYCGKNSTLNEAFWIQPIAILKDLNVIPSILKNWDGSLTIDEKNGTILSAVVGAGIKNDDNTFSGVVMGDVPRVEGVGQREDVGLYGYYHGALSYGFDVKGTAFIGSGNFRLEFDGTKGSLEIGQGFKATSDGTLSLSGGSTSGLEINGGSITIADSDGNENFKVTSSGYLTCTGASITGTLMAGTVIGNLINVTSNGLSGGNWNSGNFGSGNWSNGQITNGENFSVTSDGVLYCKGATFNGGEIQIIGSEGTTSFHVNNDGFLKCKGAEIEGNIQLTGADSLISIGTAGTGTYLQASTAGIVIEGSGTLSLIGGSIEIGSDTNKLVANSEGITITGGKASGITMENGSISITDTTDGSSFVANSNGIVLSGGKITMNGEGSSITIGTIESGKYFYASADSVEATGIKINNGNIQITQGSISLGIDGNEKPVFTVNDEGEVTINSGSINLGLDANNKYAFQATANGVIINKGSLEIGATFTGKEDGNETTYAFTVTDQGHLKCNKATIRNASISNASISNASIRNINSNNFNIDGNGNLSVSGLLSCKGLAIGESEYTPHNYNWNFVVSLGAPESETLFATKQAFDNLSASSTFSDGAFSKVYTSEAFTGDSTLTCYVQTDSEGKQYVNINKKNFKHSHAVDEGSITGTVTTTLSRPSTLTSGNYYSFFSAQPLSGVSLLGTSQPTSDP